MKIKTESTWDLDTSSPSFASLNKHIKADVVIIGAGLTGMTCAYFLRKTGLKVVVLEESKIGYGATGVTTAMLTYNIDTAFRDLLEMYGQEKTSLILNSHSEAIDAVENIVRENKIECEFIRCPNYIYSNSEKENYILKKEAETASGLSFKMEFKNDDRLGFKNSGYLEIKNQAKFHPLKYLYHLIRVCQDGKLETYKGEAIRIEGAGPFTIKTSSFEIGAQKIVVATHAPFNKKLFFKKAIYDSYVFEAEIEPDKIPEGIYEDTSKPYYYFRLDKKGEKDRLIIGGEDHRRDVKVNHSKNFQSLMDRIKIIFSGLEYRILRKWTGPIIETIDGLAYIGSYDNKNIFYATGFSGNGMTYGTLAGKIISDIILDRKNPYANLYSPLRKPTLKGLYFKGRDYFSELGKGAVKNAFRYKKIDLD